MSSILVFTSKHHDGYANFNSSYTFGWNSMSVGSQRNVIKDLKDAFQAKDPEFHFGIYYSLFEWFNPLYLKDKNGNFQTNPKHFRLLLNGCVFFSLMIVSHETYLLVNVCWFENERVSYWLYK